MKNDGTKVERAKGKLRRYIIPSVICMRRKYNSCPRTAEIDYRTRFNSALVI